MRNLLCRRGTTLLCSAGNHVVGDRGSMFRARMYKQSFSVGIRVQPIPTSILVKRDPARCARLVVLSVVHPQTQAGVTTPNELY